MKCIFDKEKLDPIDTVYGKHIYHSQDQLLWDFDLVEFERTGGIS